MDQGKEKTMPTETTFGDEVIRGLNDLVDSIKAGKPIAVREVRLDLTDDGSKGACANVTPDWRT